MSSSGNDPEVHLRIKEDTEVKNEVTSSDEKLEGENSPFQGSFKNSSESRCEHRECCFAYNLTGNLEKASFIAESVPPSTYEKLAAFWNLDPQKLDQLKTYTCKKTKSEEESRRYETLKRQAAGESDDRSSISSDLCVHPESIMTRLKTRKPPSERDELRINNFVKFLKSDDKKTNAVNLGRRTGRITKMIIQRFMEWYQSLGGSDGEICIDEFMLESLFQVGFHLPESKALEMRIIEKPTVPDSLTKLKNLPKHSIRYGLRQLLKQDIQLENIPTKMFAFGTMLPKEKPSLRFKPPKNYVRKTWMECARVPSDLESMKTVWNGLKKLRSTIAFANWLKQHDNIKPPAYLEAEGLMKINYEEWCQIYTGFEQEAENIEGVDGVVIQSKSSFTVSKEGSKTVSSNMDSIDSF